MLSNLLDYILMKAAISLEIAAFVFEIYCWKSCIFVLINTAIFYEKIDFVFIYTYSFWAEGAGILF